jgi:hypothetical protein
MFYFFIIKYVIFSAAALFDKPNYKSLDWENSITVPVGDCYTLHEKMAKSQSIRTDTCIRLHSTYDCTDRDEALHVEISPPGLENLKDVGFNMKARSVSGCGCKGTTPVTTTETPVTTTTKKPTTTITKRPTTLTTTTEIPTTEPPKNETVVPCYDPIDLVIVLDTSSSIKNSFA